MKNKIVWVSHSLLQNSPGKGLLLGIGGCILFLCYLSLSRTVIYNSDNASILLEAQAVQQGNVILHGWYVPTDNFITLDIPLYALGLLAGFSMPSLLQIIPVLIQTLVVLAAGCLASALLRDKQTFWSWLAFLGIAAFPSLDMVQRLMLGPLHIGTLLCVLLGILTYRRFLTAEQGKGRAFFLLMLLLILATVGDPFALVLFVVPLLLTEGIQTVVHKRFSWRENILLVGTLLTTILSFALRALLDILGVHILLTAGFVPTSPSNMLSNVSTAISFLYTIFHANILLKGPALPEVLPLLVNAIALSAILLAAIRWSIPTFFRSKTPEAKVLSVVLWSAVSLLASFITSTLGGGSGIRYLYPLLFLGAAISFALLFPLVKKLAILRVVIALVFLINATFFAVALYQAPDTQSPEASLIQLLEQQHLTQGLGGYWVAPIVTVQSSQKIVIRQVTITEQRISPYYFLVDEQWYTPKNLRQANFIVYREADHPEEYYRASVLSFGMPDRQYTIGTYTVLVWNSPLINHMQPDYSFFQKP